jgi:regulator of sirC expression with transglutaminase-like and TPR domain
MAIEAFGPVLRFGAFAARSSERLGLAEGALLIAEMAYPHLPHRRYLRRLDALTLLVREELGMAPGDRLSPASLERQTTAERVLQALALVIAEREGFAGNTEDYYDPRNSFLNEVLDRGVGIPITLSAIYLEVARLLGTPLTGVSTPVHFLTKWPLSEDEGGDLFLDAFHGGRIMQGDDCRHFMRSLLGENYSGWNPRWSDPFDTRAILTRILNNLKMTYLQKGETVQALEVVDRLLLLRPDLPEELRDRGLLRLALGEPLLAAADIAAYAERVPTAPELNRLRRKFAELREVHAKLN